MKESIISIRFKNVYLRVVESSYRTPPLYALFDKMKI